MTRQKIACGGLILNIFFNLMYFTGYANDGGKSLIFPLPQDITLKPGKFSVDASTFIALSEKPDASETFLAKALAYELGDKYGHPILTVKKSKLNSTDKLILIGSVSNPLIKSYCERNGLIAALTGLGNEGYILSISNNHVVVASNSKNGAFMGFASLRQIINKNGSEISIPQLSVKDTPKYAFRGIKLYLPGKENIQFFKRFIKDFASLYKYNKIILELNANMRLDRHPELNVGAVDLNRYLNYSRIDRPTGQRREFQNSSHQDNADGGILEKAEVAELVKYMKSYNMEVIPELPSLTHSYYLLSGHKDLAENLSQKYPDTYCPLKPKIYDIYFDVLDEYIDVIKPAMIHVGHDEWRVEKDVCDLCRGKDYGELYATDLTKIHGYLKKRGIKTAIWGDHLLESVARKDFQVRETVAGYKYKIPGALKPEQVLKLIPKDILIFNWFFDNIQNDQQISDFGFKQVYGNLHPLITKWEDRAKIKNVFGGAPSSWAATTEFNMSKDLLYDIFGCANLLWSHTSLSPEQLALVMEPRLGEMYRNLSGRTLPSDDGTKVSPLNITPNFNSALSRGIDSLKSNLLTGTVKSGNKIFDLRSGAQGNRAIVISSHNKASKLATNVQGILVNKDVNSIMFLHASAKEARNNKGYYSQYNFNDSAELLGWYEIVFEDGYVETIPIRYGVNILDWKHREKLMTQSMTGATSTHAYMSSSVVCSLPNADPITFFAFEWKNTRFRQKIKQVNMRSVEQTDRGNAVILIAMSISETPKVVYSTDAEVQNF
jgi:hypothetical protein